MNITALTPDRARVQSRAAAPDCIGPAIGLTTAERERASFANFARACVEDNRAELGFFAEITAQVAKTTGRQPRGFQSYLVPGDVTGPGRRDLGKSSGGGGLVGTGIEGFSHSLDTASLIGRLPMTRLPGMVGDVAVTRESAKGSTGWLGGEGGTVTDAQSTFGQIAMTPKTISGMVTVSHQLLKQSGLAGNAFIERALGVTMAEAIDRALLAGTGASGQPLGILTTSGIDTRAGTNFALADAAAMLRVAEGWAVDDSIFWVAGVAAAEDLRCRLKSANGGETLMDGDGRMLGKPVVVSRSAGDQALVCMPWTQCLMASWGGLELAADGMTYFRDGRVNLRCLWTIDFAVERAASIAAATALT